MSGPMGTHIAGGAVTAVAQRILSALDVLEARAAAGAGQGLLGGEAVDLVTLVAATARRIVPRLDALDGGAGSGAAIVAAAVDYAGTVLGQFLRLPTEFARLRPIDATGGTAREALVRQLATLARYLTTVEEAVAAADAATLLDLGEVLARRFGSGFEPSALGPAPRPAPPPPAGGLPIDEVLLLVVAFVVLALLIVLGGGAR